MKKCLIGFNSQETNPTENQCADKCISFYGKTQEIGNRVYAQYTQESLASKIEKKVTKLPLS